MKYLILTRNIDEFRVIEKFAKEQLRLEQLRNFDLDTCINMYNNAINEHPEDIIAINLQYDDDDIIHGSLGFCHLNWYEENRDYQNHIRIEASEFTNQYIIGENIPEDNIIPVETLNHTEDVKLTTPNQLKFRIGADPEFNILMQGKMISACNLIRILYKDKYKTGDMGYMIEEAGNIGWDGANSTGEIRPRANHNINNVVNNIYKLFESLAKQSSLFDLIVLSNAAPVGGHIHLEIPKNTHLSEKTQDSKEMKIADKILASFYVPLILGDLPQNLKIRLNSYGRLTDYRTDIKNNARVFEFRTPSAEWLTTPKIANATLAYIATIWNEILFHPEVFKLCKNIIINDEEQGRALQQLMMSNFVYFTKNIIKEVKKNIIKFELYPLFKDEIEYILNSPKVMADKNEAEFNIMKGWGFQTTKTPTKKLLMSEKTTKDILKEKNMDAIKDIIKINYSGDTNVDAFAEYLKKKIIAHDWKFKNNYFIFGLRKDIDYIIGDGLDKLALGFNQIKTQLDYEAVITMMINQRKRVFNKNTKNVVIIGIPYKDRIDMKTREFIEMIYKIEKGQLKMIKNNISELPIKKGQIAEILSQPQNNNNVYFNEESLAVLSPLDMVNQEEEEVTF